jgi:hypothetical protein
MRTLLLAVLMTGCGMSSGNGPDGSMATPDLSATATDDLGVSGDMSASDMSAAAPPDMSPMVIVVNAATNVLQLDACAVTPATVADVPAGTYAITLASSTLSKGNVVSGSASIDNYVIVQLPLGDGDPQADHRFLMLNGIGANAAFTLGATGTVQVMFVDSDGDANSGDGGITVAPGGYQTTVNAAANVLRWRQGCNATAAQVYVPPGSHQITLTASTLKTASGDSANYVVVRLPSELAQDDHRYIILNGVGASYVFTANDSTPLHAWYIAATAGSTGQATLTISP